MWRVQREGRGGRGRGGVVMKGKKVCVLVHTSPPGFSSKCPRPGMGRVNVQGSFWASVRIASME